MNIDKLPSQNDEQFAGPEQQTVWEMETETENRRQILRMCKEAKVDIYQFTFKSDIDTYHKVCGTEWYCMREYKLYRQLGFGIDDIELIEP